VQNEVLNLIKQSPNYGNLLGFGMQRYTEPNLYQLPPMTNEPGSGHLAQSGALMRDLSRMLTKNAKDLGWKTSGVVPQAGQMIGTLVQNMGISPQQAAQLIGPDYLGMSPNLGMAPDYQPSAAIQRMMAAQQRPPIPPRPQMPQQRMMPPSLPPRPQMPQQMPMQSRGNLPVWPPVQNTMRPPMQPVNAGGGFRSQNMGMGLAPGARNIDPNIAARMRAMGGVSILPGTQGTGSFR